MIKANELRIGNLLLNAGGVVVSTTTQTISDVELKLIVRNPIPLTEEWLLKFGFSKSVRPNCNDLYKDLNARMVLWFNEGNFAELDLIQDSKIISFKHGHTKYVHQLQNLYFALTREELQLNTTPCNNAQP